MDFLAIINRSRSECGHSATALASFTSLSSEDTRFKNWSGEAWHDLQLHKNDWQWMRKSASFATVASQQSYTPAQAGAADLADLIPDTARIYATASGNTTEVVLPFVNYSIFRDTYQFGTMRTQTGQPMCFTVKPGAKNMLLGVLPDATGYTVTYDYYRTLTDLTLTTDDPSSAGNGLDARWHMLLVYMVMESYATFEAAPEVMQRAVTGKRRLLQRLEFDQLPTLEMGPPLA